MKFSPKCKVLCLKLKEGRWHLERDRGAAGESKIGALPLYIGLLEH